MQSATNNHINSVNVDAFTWLIRWISVVGQKIYWIWFCINKFLVEMMQQHISPAAGAIFGMLVLEGHMICKAAWYTLNKYRQDPKVYGLNQWNGIDCHHRPVLLLHGAVGSWSYLGDLAITLKNAGIPVFVIDLGFGLPTNEMRKKVSDKIEEIRKFYSNSNPKVHDESDSDQLGHQSLNTKREEVSTVNLMRTTTDHSTRSNTIPLIDIVAHSNGGNLALYTAFTLDCSYIDEKGNFKFRTVRQANPSIGKIINVALPSNQIETNWLREINKIDQLFNVNAEFDALMAYKKCALIDELPSHVKYVNAGHIGIVFYSSTHNRVLQFLRQ